MTAQMHDKAGYFDAGASTDMASPLEGERPQFEQPVFTVTELSDRLIFRPRGFTLHSKEGTLFNLTHSGHSLQVTEHLEGDSTKSPQLGDETYPAWEVMKQGSGPHNVPYFRNPDLGPYENWSYANKLAFKVIWKSKSDGQWRVRMLQRHNIGDMLAPQPGALVSYAHGTALYAYLMRATWPSKPDFLPYFGRAVLHKATRNSSQQNIQLDVVSGTLANLQGPRFSLKVMRVAMRGTVNEPLFDNVDGPWAALDWQWLDDPSCWDPSAGGSVSNLGHIKDDIKKRKACDFCYIHTQSKDRSKDVTCERYGQHNRCKACVARGLPCSWTATYKIFGSDFMKESGNERTGGTLHKKAVALLIKQPYNTAATTSAIIPDPGFQSVEV